MSDLGIAFVLLVAIAGLALPLRRIFYGLVAIAAGGFAILVLIFLGGLLRGMFGAG